MDLHETIVPHTGQGSYGTVYKACIRATGEIVAIKVIPVAPHGEQSAIQKEINMLRECQHPNIVRYMVRHPGPCLPLCLTLQVLMPVRR